MKAFQNITVIVPTLNEEGFIEECLKSLLAGDYPLENLEILVIDGGSTDLTIPQVQSLIDLGSPIKLLHNEKKIVPSAVNLGLRTSKNSVNVWVGAHAVYDREYLPLAVSILEQENCGSVGGIIIPTAKTSMGKAIAVATTSKFGIGNAHYRHATERQSVDTVFGGCWRRDDILRIGGFNEQWVRNQDYELNLRIRQEIGPIIFDPSIKCHYYCRETLRGLSKQYYQYGFWRFNTFSEHPKSLKFRQLAPLALLFSFVNSFALLLSGLTGAGLAAPTAYLVASIFVGAIASVQHRIPHYIILIPIIFAAIHFSWAIGFTRNGISTLRSSILSILN